MTQLAIIAAHWIPGDPPRPAPDMLTKDEVCAMLRCNERTLEGYRNNGYLPGVGGQKRTTYRLKDVLACMDTLAKEKAR